MGRGDNGRVERGCGAGWREVVWGSELARISCGSGSVDSLLMQILVALLGVNVLLLRLTGTGAITVKRLHFQEFMCHNCL